MKLFRKVFFGLVYALPAVLFFSYHPVISLGNDATMNFELSLPLIWLVLFDCVAFINLLSLKRAVAAKGISDRKFFLFALFPLYATLSIFWSANPTRALLTAGIIWLIFFAAFALLYILPLLHPNKHFPRRLIAVFFAASAIVCLFCWLQCFLDVAGTSRAVTLLCPGCTAWTFGFPHPSGFAIEPQFMGNLLLAPTLLALYFLVFRRQPLSHLQYFVLLILASLFSTTLFLTLSRGAIYAYAVAVVILLIFALKARHQAKLVAAQASSPPITVRSRWLYLILIPAFTFAHTLIYQGIFSATSPTSDDFLPGVTKVVHQLSLGMIDLRPQSSSSEANKDSTASPAAVEKPVENSQNTSDNIIESANSSQFDGYISASTDIRLGLNKVALDTWRYDPLHSAWFWLAPPFCSSSPCTVSYGFYPPRMLFGVGLGGAGVAMSRAFPHHELIAPNAIVQNEPISLLLELGIIGIALVILALWLAFRPQSEFWRHPGLPFFCALILAYAVTLQFFSGPTNALQIYLMPPLLYIAFSLKDTKSA